MINYALTGEHYLYPTPGGAYHAVSSSGDEPSRQFLQRLLTQKETPRLTHALLRDWTSLDEQHGLELIYRLQSSGFVQGLPASLSAPRETLESLLPPLLERLSDEGKAVLAEKRGLYIGTSGYSHEATEELAALGADLAALEIRYGKLLHNNLRLPRGGWGLVNASGYSEVGFWPLHLGNEIFVLIVGGLPQFNQVAFTTLIWALGVRYGGSQNFPFLSPPTRPT
jgi:hypothetical protein